MKKGWCHTAWSVPSLSSCSCSYAYVQGPAIGPQTGEWCTAHWTVEGSRTPDEAIDVPAATKPNLYRGWKSRVEWHSDNEPLFGERGDSKLIVSVSFGTQTLFTWRSKSCPDGEASSCCRGHGDILVIVGQWQDEFLHCTDPGLEQERIDVTFRCIRQHVASCFFFFFQKRTGVACCVPTCAQGSSAATELVVNGAFW